MERGRILAFVKSDCRNWIFGTFVHLLHETRFARRAGGGINEHDLYHGTYSVPGSVCSVCRD